MQFSNEKGWGLAKRGITMSISTLLLVMCAVLGVHVVVAVIAVAKAYRDERRLPLEP